jgi:hypothetical protein
MYELTEEKVMVRVKFGLESELDRAKSVRVSQPVPAPMD